ncbi:aminoacyl-histidine dipeptidase [Salibacter sp.]|uniref:aminoacyl-histidine dipeptidase n=1 Tax=Salibacter sp. TaxID=2010995 RepID=UPI00287077E4|nr:aminoacyl-histidine dipeptidase [Salibacter sp.]MDR9398846.1 aminoacyl-histidine dipeptidase [Salibacter sp.]MDR9488361.1 aminoacyl-histidine dipeptidase [Salibacter sp.]
MNEEIKKLVPQSVWSHFVDLNAVPRPSKKEERVIEFMKKFGEDLGLETIQDEIGNVIIRKPATKGMEDRAMLTLQGHVDMVHQKNNDTDFDFDKQGIDMYIDGDWVKAKGTTLGADNGLGVAAAMALLSSDDIEHPALEALFTVDEETGMTGAKHLQPNYLKGDIMLNMDTEEDDEITIGCAGGVDTSIFWDYTEEETPNEMAGFKLTVKGLQGGHSGMDIDTERGNANKIMNRLLYNASNEVGLRLSSVDGGGLRNAIPRESVAEVAVNNEAEFKKLVKEFEALNQMEFGAVEPNFKIEAEPINVPQKVMNEGEQMKLLRAIYAMPNGVYKRSTTMDMVETSSNLARVSIKAGKVEILSLQRSSVDSQKDDLAASIRSVFELIGAKVEHTGDYPGWQPNPDSEIVKVMADLYREKFQSEPNVMACHAGLECGILGNHYPEMDMISFGPTIRGAHSPDERVSISSVQKFWDFTLDTIKRTPKK